MKLAIAAILVGAGAALEPSTAWGSLLVASHFGLYLAVGATLVAAVATVSGGQWWLPVAPTVRSIGRTIAVPAAVLMLVLVLGLRALYPWAQPEAAADHLLHAKHAWLNPPFFLGRAGLVLLGFIALTHGLLRDTAPSKRAAIAYVLFFALGISIGSWDWLMSREPAWYSTMFAVYAFANVFLSGIAIVTTLALLSLPALPVTTCHDLGRMLFAFAMFWAYIWFCQFMLIWYANIPEETAYFVARMRGESGMLFWLNPVLGFVVPAAILMSARAKRNRFVLLHAAGVVLIGRWLDTYLTVTPGGTALDVQLVMSFVATAAVLFAMGAVARRHALNP